MIPATDAPRQIRDLRKRLNVGVRAMAKLVGVSPATLNRMERGNGVSVETARALLPFVGECMCCGRPYHPKDEA
jgi:transcriptional regulator with XRE-family HTH domain